MDDVFQKKVTNIFDNNPTDNQIDKIIFQAVPKFLFTGAFIHEQSYLRLIQMANLYLYLHLQTDNAELQLLDYTYMYISDQNKVPELIGKKVILTVTDLYYSEFIGILIAKIFLKKNITDTLYPLIILAKRDNVPDEMAISLLSNDFDVSNIRHYHLENFEKIEGKVGFLLGKRKEISHNSNQSVKKGSIKEENLHNDFKIPVYQEDINKHESLNHDDDNRLEIKVNQHQNQHHQDRQDQIYDSKQESLNNRTINHVQKKDINDHPKIKTFFIGELIKKQAKIEIPIDHEHDTFEAITNTERNLKIQAESEISQETFDGYPVYKGPKRGKYIIKNGKKIYINSINTGGKSKTGFRSDLVYKVNVVKE